MYGIRKSRACILAGLAVCALLSTSWPDIANAERRTLADPMSATFRIKAETTTGMSTITGHGTAFTVDLSEFGRPRNRYLLTACHVIRDSRGNVRKSLKVELKQGGSVRWVRCRHVASDKKLDVALLECEMDLPYRASFAARDAARGASLLMIGSPEGVPLRRFKGSVTETPRIGNCTARVEYIREGCSGGPIFDSASRRIIGLVVAGVGSPRSDKMDPHTCLYVPRNKLIGFVRVALKSSGGSSRDYNSVAQNAPPCCPAPPYRRIAAGAPRVDRTGMWLP